MLPIGSIPTILPDIASTTLFETKITKNCHFLTGIDYNLLSMQKDVKCRRIFFSTKRFTKGKICTSCSNFHQNWSASEEKIMPRRCQPTKTAVSPLCSPLGTSITSRRLDFCETATFNVGIFAYFRRARHQVYCFEPGLY